MRRGIYSIGTNSTRALVAELNGEAPQILKQLSIGTRLGEGVREQGRLSEAAIERTVDALRSHRREVEPLAGGDVTAIATSAVRRAQNADAFARAVREATGARLHVIDGTEEASCSFAGAVAVAPRESGVRTYGVLDPGGGSTEFATGTREAVDRTASFEIGAVRLSEAVPDLMARKKPVSAAALHEARVLAREALRPLLEFPTVDRLIFVGGTATTSVSITHARDEREEIAALLREQLEDVVRLLASKTVEERRVIPGMNPQRADILLAGTLLLEAAFDFTARSEALVATGDLLLGYLLRHPH